MTNSTTNNRVVFGVTRSGRGWNVWNSVSVNWGTWSTNRVSGYFNTREEAEEEARRQAQDQAFSGWDVRFTFRNNQPASRLIGWQKRSRNGKRA